MRRNVVACDAPREWAASSSSASSSRRTGCTVLTTNGSVTNIIASTIAVRVYATLMPTGDAGPYSASSVNPATIVGNANGRSMIAFTAAFPRKSSRTRTHAVIVPSTAFRSATSAAAPSVSFRAAIACGDVTASQKLCAPSLLASHTRAAIGSATMTIRKRVTKPRDRAVAALSPDARTRRGSTTAVFDISC